MSIFQKKDAEHYKTLAKQEREKAKDQREIAQGGQKSDYSMTNPKEASKDDNKRYEALKKAEQHEKKAKDLEEKARDHEKSQGRGR
jgi:hypothetical protein